MFDFEKLEIYQVVRQLNVEVLKYLVNFKDQYIKDQWRRATLSIALNLAEGTGRMSTSDKKRFYTIARSSAFECVALLQVTQDMELINTEKYDQFYSGYEKISKMLLGMYRSMAKQTEQQKNYAS